MSPFMKASLLFISLLAVQPAHADDYVLTLKDHVFTPKDLTIPAKQKVKLIIKNDSANNAEFESADLGREKVVTAGKQIAINLGPLEPGTYTYVDDFHRDTTGTLTVK